MPDFVTVAKVNEIPPGTIKAFEVGEDYIAVANLNGTFYAVSDVCTHMGTSLADGEIIDDNIMCPAHASLFNLKTGAVVRTPANGPLPTYDLKVEGEEIKVATQPRPAE